MTGRRDGHQRWRRTAAEDPGGSSDAPSEVITLAEQATTPVTVTERFTGHIDALLGDVSARGAHPPLRYLNWITRAFGPAVAAELDRQRRAQYGFCPTGHARSARAVRAGTGRAVGTQLFCPACEACAA